MAGATSTKSHGAWLHDARASRDLLDFCTFFASNPIGYNHPRMKDPAFLAMLHRVAQVKPSLSDLYSVEYAWFVDVFGSIAMPRHMRYAFFIEGGTLGVENALKTAFDWKVRRNRARGIPGEKGQQVIHFKQGFHGRSGYALSLTNTDPTKTDLFPKFKWPRIANPGLRFPVTPEVEAEVGAAEEEEEAGGLCKLTIKESKRSVTPEGSLCRPLPERCLRHDRPCRHVTPQASLCRRSPERCLRHDRLLHGVRRKPIATGLNC